MLKKIKTEEQYNVALSRVYTLMQKDIKGCLEESNELEALSILIKGYENRNYQISSSLQKNS